MAGEFGSETHFGGSMHGGGKEKPKMRSAPAGEHAHEEAGGKGGPHTTIVVHAHHGGQSHVVSHNHKSHTSQDHGMMSHDEAGAKTTELASNENEGAEPNESDNMMGAAVPDMGAATE